MSTSRHRALDGGIVSISTSAHGSAQHTASIEVATPFGVREFVSGRPSFGDAHATDFGITSFDEEYSLHGGRLKIGKALVERSWGGYSTLARVGIWQGGKHSLAVHMYDRESADLVTVFDSLRIEEFEDGLVAIPNDPEVTPVIREGPTCPRGVASHS